MMNSRMKSKVYLDELNGLTYIGDTVTYLLNHVTGVDIKTVLNRSLTGITDYLYAGISRGTGNLVINLSKTKTSDISYEDLQSLTMTIKNEILSIIVNDKKRLYTDSQIDVVIEFSDGYMVDEVIPTSNLLNLMVSEEVDFMSNDKIKIKSKNYLKLLYINGIRYISYEDEYMYKLIDSAVKHQDTYYETITRYENKLIHEESVTTYEKGKVYVKLNSREDTLEVCEEVVYLGEYYVQEVNNDMGIRYEKKHIFLPLTKDVDKDTFVEQGKRAWVIHEKNEDVIKYYIDKDKNLPVLIEMEKDQMVTSLFTYSSGKLFNYRGIDYLQGKLLSEHQIKEYVTKRLVRYKENIAKIKDELEYLNGLDEVYSYEYLTSYIYSYKRERERVIIMEDKQEDNLTGELLRDMLKVFGLISLGVLKQGKDGDYDY